MNTLRVQALDFERCSPSLDDDAVTRKREAVTRYRSQLRALRTRKAFDDLGSPEAHWRVRPRSQG